MPKVHISGYKPKRKRRDVVRNEELVLSAFLRLEKLNNKRPTRIEVSKEIGLSRERVGRYYKSLNL